MNNSVTPQFTEGPVNADFSGVLQVHVEKAAVQLPENLHDDTKDIRGSGTLGEALMEDILFSFKYRNFIASYCRIY